MTATTSNGTSTPSVHTAVLHVHGIGDQWRLQELSRLVDALDRMYLSKSKGKARLSIRTGFELGRGPLAGSDPLPYLEFTLPASGNTVRFYEVYWAPITGNGLPAREVLTWLVRLGPTPLLRWLGWRSQWRSLRRLHLSVAREAGIGRASPLLQAYDDFSRPPPRDQQAYQRGTYDEFEAFLVAEYPGNAHLLAEARQWRDAYIRAERRHTLAVGAILLIIGAGLLAAFDLARGLYTLVTEGTPQTFLTLPPAAPQSPGGEQSRQIFAAQSGAVLTLAAFLLSPASRFLRQSVADLVFWATYQETNEKNLKRQLILKRCQDTLEHVLTGPAERVVLNAHSLGSTIAYDTLLQLARRNDAEGSHVRLPLGRIEALLTYGSPIDKIYYFFEVRLINPYRYEAVIQDLRGDLYKKHFGQLRWLNCYEEGDAISGALDYPSALGRPATGITNLYTPNFNYPEVATCHNGYADNALYVTRLWDAIEPGTVPVAPMDSKEAPRHARRQRLQQLGMFLPAALYLTSSVTDAVARANGNSAGIGTARTLFVLTGAALVGNLALYMRARRQGNPHAF